MRIGRLATVAVETFVFRQPMNIDDTLCVDSAVEKVGRTSIRLKVEAWARR